MDEVLLGFENLKVSAFSKYSKLTGNINNVTIGPNSSLIQENLHSDLPKNENVKYRESKKKSEEKPKKERNHPPLPINQVLKELETQRQEEVQEAVNSHYVKFENFTASQRRERQNNWLHIQHAFIQSMQDSENSILQVLNQTDINNSKENEKLVKHFQDMIQRRIEYEQRLEKTKQKQRILNENIEKIKKYQSEFGMVYQEIITIIKSCVVNEELKNLLGESLKLLKSLSGSFDEIIYKCKTYCVDEEQQLKAASILNQVRVLKTQVEDTVMKMNAKKKDMESKLQLHAQAKETAAKSYSANLSQNIVKETSSSLEQCVSVSNMKKYIEIKQFLSQYTETFKELLANPQLKQFRFDCKKAVNIPVNAISAVNAEHLKDKYVKLSNLLSGKTISVADRQINASKYPQGIPFCMDLLAKKFVLQGDLMISSNPEAAFCYATIIISLWNEYPDFGKLLLGYFYTQCPYLVPFYIPKTEDQTNEDYYIILGYKYNDGQIEKQDKFLKRMTGILRLYFAVLIAKPKNGQTNKNPHDIRNAWIFLASILKLEPQLDITATAIHIFLETVGYEMQAVYGTAFKKLIRIISEKFMPALRKFDSGGPVSRLEVLLQDYKSKGEFDKPNGVLSINFW